MSYSYNANRIYLNYVTSRLDENQVFVVRPTTGPMSGNTDYPTAEQAIDQAKAYDENLLPMLPTTDNSTTASNIITFKNYNGSSYTTVSLTNCVGTITANTSNLPHGDVTLDDAEFNLIKEVVANVQAIYNKADQLIISNPSDTFDTAILAVLLDKVNTAFSTDIPTAVGTYNYNKIKNRWELQS